MAGRKCRRTVGVLALCIAGVTAFHASTFHERINGRAATARRIPKEQQHASASSLRPSGRSPPSTSTTQLNMFMGSDGGILGVGAPEVFTILLVGYFVLGPSDLYKLVKEIGKFIQNIRTLGSDLSTTFESNMESTLQLEELRKAQRELNDAFSFRRSINTEETAGPFSVTAGSAQIAEANRREEEMAAAVAATTGEGAAVIKQRKIRRRVKRRKEEADVLAAPPSSVEPAIATAPVNLAPVSPISSCAPDELLANNVPDLEMPHKADAAVTKTTAEELALIESEFAKYTAMPDDLVTVDVGAQSRFQQQLSGQWNESIVQNTAKLAPMGALMEQVALLEQERKAALDRLEEEFAKRKEIETQFYQKRRLAIEEKITETQEKAFGVSSKPL